MAPRDKPKKRKQVREEENDENEENEDERSSLGYYNGPLLPLLKKVFPNGRTPLIDVEMKCVVPPKYRQWEERFRDFNVRQRDIFVVSVARSGTTWMQELVWCIVKGLDHERGDVRLGKRFQFLEKALHSNAGTGKSGAMSPDAVWENLMNRKGIRLIKTHFPIKFLPTKMWTVQPKVIYICRDPRDVCVSSYYHNTTVGRFSGTLKEYAKIFLGDLTICGTYWKHVLSFWELRDEEHVFFARYEEMKADLPSMIKRIADFLEYEIDDETVELMDKHLSFESMKSNKSINKEGREFRKDVNENPDLGFIRKGEVGDWKNQFDAKTIKKFEKWTNKHVKDSEFPYYRDY